MANEYDAIVIGGGPNGLTCSAYLAKAGLKVLLLEKRHELGGGMYTEDFGTPFRFNAHATYMLLAELMPAYRDLQLAEKGVAFVRPAAQVSFIHKDGKALVFSTDPNRSAESIRQFSHADAASFERMYREIKEMCDDCLIPAHYVPPLPLSDQLPLLEATPLGKRVAGLSQLSPREVVDSYGFEDPRVQGALLHLATMWGIDPDSRGVGSTAALFIYRMMNAALVKGGTHSLSSGLYGAVLRNGGNIVEWADVDSIALTNGRATGVATRDGDEYQGKAIISTLNPHQTFLELVGRDHLPAHLRGSVEGWKWDEWSLFCFHLGIKGGPPRYTAAAFNPDVDATLLNIIGTESPDELTERLGKIKAGQLPEPGGGATCTSLHDPLQASKGPFGPLHTLRWEGSSPFALAGQQWDDVKQTHADRCFETWQRYAPNLREAKVLFSFTYSPLDVQRRLTTMTRGSIKHGAYTSEQLGHLRPSAGCSGYRTPIAGLYVAGASTYPGGMVTLAPGYNAAKVVAEDLGANVWWSPPDYVVRARERNYLPAPAG